jgi:hypothetical protein
MFQAGFDVIRGIAVIRRLETHTADRIASVRHDRIASVRHDRIASVRQPIRAAASENGCPQTGCLPLLLGIGFVDACLASGSMAPARSNLTRTNALNRLSIPTQNSILSNCKNYIAVSSTAGHHGNVLSEISDLYFMQRLIYCDCWSIL